MRVSAGRELLGAHRETGTVVDTSSVPFLPGRVLVRFDTAVSARGLVCHNAVPSSLYIPESDLEYM
jgi:hypothetical protein